MIVLVANCNQLFSCVVGDKTPFFSDYSVRAEDPWNKAEGKIVVRS